MFESEDAGVMAIVPGDLVGVTAYRRHRYGRKGRPWLKLSGRQDPKRIRRPSGFISASGAGTVISQVLPGI
jgi:hypothetical protein